MGNKTIAFTIVSFNYLSLARILGKSFKKHNPDIEFMIMIMDKVSDSFDRSKEEFEIATIDDLEIENKEQLTFKYNITEANTAVKPFFIRQYLMDKLEAEKIFYIDPDICFFGSMKKAIESLDKNDMVLTPHILSPMPDDGADPNEISIMRVGCYNLGFLGVKNNERTRKFMDWWSDRLYKYSISCPEKGLFTDQKWMDYAPSFLDKVYVLKDPGYNTAYWNLHERNDFSKINGEYFVNKHPLIFFHFSGYLIDDKNRISKFQNRFKLDQFGETLKELFDEYGENLKRNDFFNTRKIPYAFSFFDNGVVIPDIIRRIYYDLDNKDNFGNPYITKDSESFYNWLNSTKKGTHRITNLAYEIYKRRPEVQKIIPNPKANEVSLINWVASALKTDYRTDEAFINRINDLLPKSLPEKIGNFMTIIEKKYLIDSFLPFRLLKTILGKNIFRFIKKRFYKYQGRLLRKDFGSIPVSYFDSLKFRFKDKKYEDSIVLFRPHGVGDLLMSLPAFKKFKEKNKDKYIILYVYEESYPLMKTFDFFDEVISIPRSFNYWEGMKYIPIPIRSTFLNLMVEVKTENGNNSLDNNNNRIYRNFSVSKILEVPSEFERIHIPINQASEKKATSLLSKYGVDRNKFIVATFETSNDTRNWYPAYYKEFLEYVLSLGYQIFLVGNKEKNTLLFPNNKNLVNLIGETKSLLEVVEIVRKSKYVITTDTYLSHLAGIMDIPQLAIFTGGIDPKSRVSFYQKKVIAKSEDTCYCWDMPCKHEELRGKNELCRINLKPEKVKLCFNKLILENYDK